MIAAIMVAAGAIQPATLSNVSLPGQSALERGRTPCDP
jgi:hypothetical protein